MRSWDIAGYLASGLVVAAFCMKDIGSLRAVALASNVAFLAYGIGLHLPPVWLLHAVLLPVNSWRLCQEISCRRAKIPRTALRLPSGAGDIRKRRDHGASVLIEAPAIIRKTPKSADPRCTEIDASRPAG